jgi:hypothetical protein
LGGGKIVRVYDSVFAAAAAAKLAEGHAANIRKAAAFRTQIDDHGSPARGGLTLAERALDYNEVGAEILPTTNRVFRQSQCKNSSTACEMSLSDPGQEQDGACGAQDDKLESRR